MKKIVALLVSVALVLTACGESDTQKQKSSVKPVIGEVAGTIDKVIEPMPITSPIPEHAIGKNDGSLISVMDLRFAYENALEEDGGLSDVESTYFDLLDIIDPTDFAYSNDSTDFNTDIRVYDISNVEPEIKKLVSDIWDDPLMYQFAKDYTQEDLMCADWKEAAEYIPDNGLPVKGYSCKMKVYGYDFNIIVYANSSGDYNIWDTSYILKLMGEESYFYNIGGISILKEICSITDETKVDLKDVPDDIVNSMMFLGDKMSAVKNWQDMVQWYGIHTDTGYDLYFCYDFIADYAYISYFLGNAAYGGIITLSQNIKAIGFDENGEYHFDSTETGKEAARRNYEKFE